MALRGCACLFVVPPDRAGGGLVFSSIGGRVIGSLSSNCWVLVLVLSGGIVTLRRGGVGEFLSDWLDFHHHAFIRVGSLSLYTRPPSKAGFTTSFTTNIVYHPPRLDPTTSDSTSTASMSWTAARADVVLVVFFSFILYRTGGRAGLLGVSRGLLPTYIPLLVSTNYL